MEELHAMEEKHSGRLNFKAPLLSTRRPSSYLEDHATSVSVSASASINRVPFSWEQAPGKPKDCSGTSDQEAAFTPRPKPPPGRWKPPPNHEDEDEDEISGKDILSLTEAIDMVQDDQQEEASTASSSDLTASSSNLDRLSLHNSTTFGEVINDDGAGSTTPSPNFMMERFLPDAAALAAATSAHNLSKQVLNHYPETRPPVVAESTKACGLEMLLPWRIRQRLAGVNTTTLVHQQPKRSINAKHKRRFSSLHLPSPDWTCK